MVRRLFPVETLVFLAVWLGLMIGGRSALFRDPGALWHPVVGSRMLDQGQVVHADWLSFTRAGEPWVAHGWLAEIGMALLQRVAGLDGLLLATATVLAAAYAMVAARMRRAGMHWLGIWAIVAVTLLAGAPQFHTRPLVVSVLLTVVSFGWLLDVDTGRRSIRWLWWLVPVVWLWANIHPGVLGGLGTVGLVAAGWLAGYLLSSSREASDAAREAGAPTDPSAMTAWHGSPIRTRADAAQLLGILLACGAVLLLNPYGLGLPLAWLETLRLPLPAMIEEHRPLRWASMQGMLVGGVALGYLATWLALRRGATGAPPVPIVGGQPAIGPGTVDSPPLPIRPSHAPHFWLLIVPLVWFVLAVMRVRAAGLFAAMAAMALVEVLPHTRWAAWLRRCDWLRDPHGDARLANGAGVSSRIAAVVPLLVVLLTFALQVADARVPVVGRGWAHLSRADWPLELLPTLEGIERQGPPGTPIFNDLAFGGLLIGRTPGLRVFVDDRCALYGESFLMRYDAARRERPAKLDRWRTQYGFRHALVETGGAFDRYLAASEAWRLIDRTPVASLYVFDEPTR